MKPENENKKISLIEKDGLAVEIVGCPDEHGFVFAGPLAPETVLSVSEFLTAVDAIRSRIQRMPYVMKNAIVKFPFSVVIHSADTALDLDIIISPLRPARNALLRAIREYFSDNTIRSSRTFALLDMLEKAIGKPVKVDVKTKIRLVDAPFSFDDDNREYLPDEFFALLNRVKGYISEDFASSFTIQTELKCDAFGFHTFSRYVDITIDNGPIPSIVDLALNDIEREMKANIEMPDEGVDAMDLISKAINIISDKMEGTYNDRSVITGYSKLDIMLNGGFRPQDYVIIAARPSIGKTAFAVSMMLHMLDEGKSVVFYSLEMSDIQIANRMLAAASGVNLRSIIKGSFSEAEFDPLLNAGNRLVTEKLTVIDTPNMRLSDIRSTARMLKRKGKADIIIIDYIGLIDAGLRNGTPRHEAVAYVSRSLKQLARELDIPIVVLSQVTRDSEEREPLLSSLRDSGSIEQDADTVMFLHRKRKLTDEDLSKCPKNRRGQVMIGTKVILAKQRNGETGSILTAYIPATASFRDADNSISFIEPDANR